MKKETTQTDQTTRVINRFKTFRYALLLEGVLVGALAGVVIVLFRLLINWADEGRNWLFNAAAQHPWAIVLLFAGLVLAALAVNALLHWEPFISGSGIPQVEGEMHAQLHQNWWKVLTAKFAGALVSLGCGLSLGREGPSIQLGAMVGKGFSQLTKRMKTEEKLLLSCGASAGLAAAFNAPFAGVLFSLEEVHKNFTPEILLSSMASSITADFVTRNVFGLKPVFSFQVQHMMPLTEYGHVIALGLLLGLFGVVYNVSLKKSQDLFQKIPRQSIRLLIPFLLTGVLGFVYPAVLGGGHNLMAEIAGGTMLLGGICLLFVIKFLFSMVSFGSGAPGGIFLPLLVLGAMLGAAYSDIATLLFGAPARELDNFIILGMAGYFAAIVRAPVTGIILISEMTGSFSHLLTLSMVSLFAYLVPDLLKCRPVYDMLLHRLLEKRKKSKPAYSGEKVLIEGRVCHGSPAEGRRISQIRWPETCLVVSLIRGEDEFVPKGGAVLHAGDRIVVLCDETAAEEAHDTIQLECTHVSP